MSLVIISDDHPTPVQCAGKTYLLSVGEDGTLYIENEGHHELIVAVSDDDGDITVHGQWVNLTVREEK